MALEFLNDLAVNSSTEGKMFAMVQVILCTIYLLIFISEVAPESVAEVNIPKILNSEKTKEEEENSTDAGLPKVINADSIQIIVKSSNLEKEKQQEENSTVKESPIIVKSLNLEQTEKEGGNSTEKELSITKTLNPENTKKEGGNSAVNESPVITDTSIHDKPKKNEENSTIEENQNSTVKESPIIHSSNPENEKIEERISTERESETANFKDFSQKSPTEMSPPKIQVKRQSKDEREERRRKNGRAFRTAYKNCNLLIGEHYLNVDVENQEEATKCVRAEVKKFEMYEGEYTKLLDNNAAFIKRA